MVYLQQVLIWMDMPQTITVFHQKNNSAIEWAKSKTIKKFSRRKYIAIQHHSLMHVINEGKVSLNKVISELISADFLTN